MLIVEYFRHFLLDVTFHSPGHGSFKAIIAGDDSFKTLYKREPSRERDDDGVEENDANC